MAKAPKDSGSSSTEDHGYAEFSDSTRGTVDIPITNKGGDGGDKPKK